LEPRSGGAGRGRRCRPAWTRPHPVRSLRGATRALPAPGRGPPTVGSAASTGGRQAQPRLARPPPPDGSGMIQADRIKDEFLDLTSITSMSRREGATARRYEVLRKGMGAPVELDEGGEKSGGETGNILARFGGTKPGAPPFLLSAHMDTVGPAEKIRLVVDGDIVRTDHTTVLGGDD